MRSTSIDTLYTSAGVTSGMDMALAMVEADWGKACALAVAQELVMYLKRPGGQSQFSRFLSAERRDDVFGNLELWILEHLDADLSVESLARRADMSTRHFARMFTQRIGARPPPTCAACASSTRAPASRAARRGSSRWRENAGLRMSRSCGARFGRCSASRRRNIGRGSCNQAIDFNSFGYFEAGSTRR